MAQFIGYIIDGFDTDKAVPVATATDRDTCLKFTVQRALAGCYVYSSLQVQQRDDVSAKDFAALSSVIDKFCEEKGLPR